jgi:hypothetical protein
MPEKKTITDLTPVNAAAPAVQGAKLPAVAPPLDPSQYPPEDELPLPRVSIIQAMSDAAAKGGHKPGLFLNQLTDEEFPVIQGIVLTMGLSRTRWVKGQREPICRSRDHDHGEGDPGGECGKCALAAWGEDDTPPACAENYDLVIVDEQEMPFIFSLSKTGIKPARQFIAGAKARGLPLFCFGVEITLRQQTNEQGTFYVPKFAIKGQSPAEDWPALSASATRLFKAMRRAVPDGAASPEPTAEY